MEIKVLESGKNNVIFELPGEDHTFCNVVKKELWNNKDVEIGTYNIAHPLIRTPKFIVEVNKGTPKKALEKAIDDVKKTNSEFVKNFKKLK